MTDSIEERDALLNQVIEKLNNLTPEEATIFNSMMPELMKALEKEDPNAISELQEKLGIPIR